MYPFFEIFDGFFVYTFGLTLTVCFFAFLRMLKKLSYRYSYSFSFFLNNILWYFLSVFIFSRLFFVLSKWKDMKFIDNPFEFFIMNDYNFSLFGAIFGFFLVFFISLKLKKYKIINYLDGIVVSFLFISIIGYIGAFLGGQIYGNEVSGTLSSIGVLYNNPFSNVPYEVPVFPLAIVYSIISFILFSVLYILSIFINIKGLIGYIGLIIFSSSLLILENFNGDPDTFKILFNINLTQICSIILIFLSFYGLRLLYKDKNIKKHKINV